MFVASFDIDIPSITPVLYSAVTNPFLGYVCTQNTPNPQLSKTFEKWSKLFLEAYSYY